MYDVETAKTVPQPGDFIDLGQHRDYGPELHTEVDEVRAYVPAEGAYRVRDPQGEEFHIRRAPEQDNDLRLGWVAVHLW